MKGNYTVTPTTGIEHVETQSLASLHAMTGERVRATGLFRKKGEDLFGCSGIFVDKIACGNACDAA
jgi:hypothetical protein